MKSTIGKLQFATSAVTPGKPFLRRLHDTNINVKKPYHMIQISKPVRAYLQYIHNDKFTIPEQALTISCNLFAVPTVGHKTHNINILCDRCPNPGDAIWPRPLGRSQMLNIRYT